MKFSQNICQYKPINNLYETSIPGTIEAKSIPWFCCIDDTFTFVKTSMNETLYILKLVSNFVTNQL